MNNSDGFTITNIWAWEQFSRTNRAQWDSAPRIDPHNNIKQEHDRLPPGTDSVTKEVWENLPWNPMLGFDYEDPKAGNKPSWGEVVLAYKATILERFPSIVDGASAVGLIESHRKTIAHESHHVGEHPIHVGNGLTHMPGLIHLLDLAGNAGKKMPPVVMRETGEHAPKTLHLQKNVRDLVSGIAYRRNLVESAHNAIIAPFLEKLSRFQDRSLDPGIRYDLAAELDAYWKTYPAQLKAEMARLESADLLPDDVDELRKKYAELLEGAATERYSQITHSVTPQGVILDPSCIDQGRATRKLSQLKQIVQINLARAEGKAALKAAYKDGVAQIEALQVERVPVFHQVPSATEVTHSQTIEARKLLIKADHPEDLPPIPGLVAASGEIVPKDGFGTTGTITTLAAPGQSPVLFTLTVQGSLPVLFALHARNVCGPADILVTLRPPAGS